MPNPQLGAQTHERSPGDLVLSSSDTEDSLARLGWSHGSLLVKGLSELELGTSGMFPIHQCWRPDPGFYMAGRLGAESLGQAVEKWAQVGVYLDFPLDSKDLGNLSF